MKGTILAAIAVGLAFGAGLSTASADQPWTPEHQVGVSQEFVNPAQVAQVHAEAVQFAQAINTGSATPSMRLRYQLALAHVGYCVGATGHAMRTWDPDTRQPIVVQSHGDLVACTALQFNRDPKL